MTTKTLFLAVSGSLAFAAIGNHADADISRTHGATCAPKFASKDLVGADERGMYNASSTASATMTCMAPDLVEHMVVQMVVTGTHQKANARELRVLGRDLSSTSAFSCYPFATEEDGFSSWGPTRWSCPATGGCASESNDYVGNVSLMWNLDTAFTQAQRDNADHIGVVCTVPPTTASGSSYVKTIKLLDSTVTSVTSPDEGEMYGDFVTTWR